MNKIIKSFLIVSFGLLLILLSIRWTYAEITNKLIEIIPISNKIIELKLEKPINNSDLLKSDLEIYKSLFNIATKDTENTKKITLTLTDSLKKNSSYSIISISDVEWDIVFSTSDSLINQTIQNNGLSWEDQGIKSILIKTDKTIELTFLKNVNVTDLEFQFYERFKVEKIKKSNIWDNIKIFLEKDFFPNSEYLLTLTYIETSDSNKHKINKWISYFKTIALEEYNIEENKLFWEDENSTSENLLEDALKSALENNDLLENELELNSAEEKPENTQLEKLALEQKETPDSGSATWILLLGAFILNTLYFLSRRKKK